MRLEDDDEMLIICQVVVMTYVLLYNGEASRYLGHNAVGNTPTPR